MYWLEKPHKMLAECSNCQKSWSPSTSAETWKGVLLRINAAFPLISWKFIWTELFVFDIVVTATFTKECLSAKSSWSSFYDLEKVKCSRIKCSKNFKYFRWIQSYKEDSGSFKKNCRLQEELLDYIESTWIRGNFLPKFWNMWKKSADLTKYQNEG